jgi:hypothetical protein
LRTHCQRIRKIGSPAFTFVSYLFPSTSVEREKGAVAKVITYAKACYEIQDVEMGKVYRWRPESVVVKCDCGEEPSLTASNSTCEKCGAVYRDIVEEVLFESWFSTTPIVESACSWHRIDIQTEQAEAPSAVRPKS